MLTTPSTREFISVPYYGIHWTEDGISFIEQGGPRGGTNVLGLAMKSPFRVRLKGRIRHCNHLIPMQAPTLNDRHLERISKVAKDPLFRAMMPLPKPDGSAGIWYFPDADDKLSLYILLLSRMSSPIEPIRVPIWTTDANRIVEDLKQTNVQPLAISDVQPKDVETVKRISSMAVQLPRRLILTGRPEVVLPPSVERSATTITEFDIKDLIALPWESYGASIVRRYMRGDAV